MASEDLAERVAAAFEQWERRWAKMDGEVLANNILVTHLMNVVMEQTENAEGSFRVVQDRVEKSLAAVVLDPDGGPRAEERRMLTIESARRTVDATMSAIAAVIHHRKKG
jgi:hypothetical protein